MKRQSLKLFLAAAMAVTLAGCREDITPDAAYQDRSLSFELSMAVTDSDQDNTSTKSMEIKSADGGISLPLEYSVSDGIEVPALASEPQTKGTQYNTSDELKTAVGTFQVTAWNSDHSRFIPTPADASAESTVNFNSTSGGWALAGTAPLWKKADVKTFFAYTNLPAGAAVSCTDDASHTFSYTSLQTDATAQKDALLGYYKGNGDSNGDGVSDAVAMIQFIHPLTAVVFKQGDFEGITAIKSLSIEGVYDGGEAIATYAYDTDGKLVPTFDWGTSRNTKTTVTQTVPNSGALPGKGNKIGESFIMLPQVLSTDNVTIRVVLTTSAGNVEVLSEINTGEWKSGKTNTYTLGCDAT